jgi:hypothetical protein
MEGLDIIVSARETPGADHLALARLMPGTEVTATGCTLTLAVDERGAAVFVVGAQSGPPNRSATPETGDANAKIRLRDSFVRSGGSGIVVTAGRRLDLELANVLVSTEESLLHAFGGARPARAGSPTVKVSAQQVTARVQGGLIHLDSTQEEPELSAVAVVVENSIMSMANRDDPLLQLTGRDQLDDLGDKIRWEGRNVAYDRIKIYRRDEVLRTGVSPRIYDRANWTSAFLPKDESPVLGDVKFLRQPDAARLAWTLERDDLRIAPESPVADRGSDLSRIPQAPTSTEL